MVCLFTDPQILPIVEKAAIRNAKREKSDVANGFPAESSLPLDVRLRTVMCSLLAGLHNENMDFIAEGYALLMDIHLSVTKDKIKDAH